MTDILFIVNPIAGHHNTQVLHKLIKRCLNSNEYRWRLEYTAYCGHARKLASECLEKIVVAVGGDGTVNEVASGIIGTDKILGIIPTGSGNGFALHHGISKSKRRALGIINKQNIKIVDCGKIDGRLFCCTCGVGLDAEVSVGFSKTRGRGLLSYITNTIKQIFTYKAATYSLHFDSKSWKGEALMVVIGNANQWGNNAHIIPCANTSDGELDIVIVKPTTIVKSIILSIKLFNGHILDDNSIIHFKCQNLDISPVYDKHLPFYCHYDGEPYLCKNESAKVEIIHSALQLLIK